MDRTKTITAAVGFLCMALCLGVAQAADVVPTDIQQPGTQPGDVGNLESPDKCDNCHGGYNSSVEPAHNWRGSMMAHAGRDPIFWATVAIAEQDFDGAGDLCIRCHSTGGWLAGRSTPTDGSGLAAGDSDGVECDFCHKLTNPDNSEHLGVMFDPFIANTGDNPGPASEGFFGSGIASMWGGSEKLGPYSDAAARHQSMASKFHRSVDFCGTCHDVSNPAVGNLAHNSGAQPGADPVVANGILGGAVDGKAAFNNPPYAYGIVERTFSEYKSGLISQTLVDDFPTLPADLQGGALQAIYDATTAARGTANYEDGDDRYYSCQTCHMRAVTGTGCNKKGVPVRTDQPLHDMTGGNYWMPLAIQYLDAQGKLRLGGAMTALQTNAMLDGALRAKEQLDLAATLSVSGNGNSVKIVNHTGHKLISGYPEGRRMWLRIEWLDGSGNTLRVDGEYGPLDLQMDLDGDGQNDTVETILDLEGTNTKIYEAHMGMTQEWAAQLVDLGYPAGLALNYDRVTGVPDLTLGDLAAAAPGTEHETFHFVLNNSVVKDNRIPPYGMSYEVARVRNALPVPASQYGGGPTYNYYDEVQLNPPSGAHSATIELLYQPTSWEYIQFLYLANNGTNAFLADEGVNMLDAWLNAGEPDQRMAKPYVMASATWGTPPGACDAPTPSMTSATSGDKQVIVSWQEIPADPILIDGYRLYYDQAGKAQLVVDYPWPAGGHTDINLTNGQEYCYKVTSYTATCESDFSNILCAVPTQPGQEAAVSVSELVTGKWVREGKGKNATTTFVIVTHPDPFTRGDAVVVQATVKDEGGAPVPDATVTIAISGPESVNLTTGPSDANGIAEATWQTAAPNRKGTGGTASGDYTATTSGVNASGFVWDGVGTEGLIKLQ
jgi:hypothetical protein